MKPRKSGLLQGTLDLLILKTLAAGSLHGHAIAQRILITSRETLDVQQGSFYPALHRLERKRLVEAEWRQPENGRMAKFYSLTKAGRQQLAAELDQWQQSTKAVGRVLQG